MYNQRRKANAFSCHLQPSCPYLSLPSVILHPVSPLPLSLPFSLYTGIQRGGGGRAREGGRKGEREREGRRWMMREIILQYSIVFVHNNFSPKIFIVQKFPLLKLEFFAFSRRRNFNSFLQLFFPYSLYAYSSVPKDILKSPKQILEKKKTGGVLFCYMSEETVTVLKTINSCSVHSHSRKNSGRI